MVQLATLDFAPTQPAGSSNVAVKSRVANSVRELATLAELATLPLDPLSFGSGGCVSVSLNEYQQNLSRPVLRIREFVQDPP